MNRRGNPPGWFTFLISIAFIFALFYLWQNVQNFVRSGGISVAETTQIANRNITATIRNQRTAVANAPTRRPTATPKPACQTFEVNAPSGVVRQAASTRATVIESLPRGTPICVLSSQEGADGFLWYFIDRDPVTYFIEGAYMREDVVIVINPTPTASPTIELRLATVTLTYTPTPTP